MVNLNFKKFNEVQQKHKGTYIGSNQEQNNPTVNDPEYNNHSDTDISVGATGREVLGEK